MWSAVLLTCFPLALATSPAKLLEPVDLSHQYDENTLYWPEGTPFHFTKIFTINRTNDWYAANDFETAEHCGTHLDAPYHFNRNGWKVGDIPLHRFFGKGILVDVREKAEQDPDYLVDAEDFEAWEKQHGLIPEGAIVLLDFGWTAKYHKASLYFGTNDLKNMSSFHFPGLSESGAKWLAETGVYGVGTDTASIDYGQSKEFLSHKVLNEHNIFMLEHVALPATPLPASGYQVITLPMKLHHGSGAPVRIVAVPNGTFQLT